MHITNKVILTSEEHQAKREAIVNKIKEMYPHVQFKVGKYTTGLIYYSVSVCRSKIKVNKEIKTIYSYPNHSNDDAARILTNGVYLTEQEAINAINLIMPKAKTHFETCLGEYRALTKRLEFNLGFNYDGDTYGIYNEYDYISFKMNGFNFQFEIES